MPRVSVLLTSYKRPQMLTEAIGSVLAQTYQDYELLVLDDNSPRDSGVPEVLLGYWDHPRVILVKSDVTDAERPLTTRYATMLNLGLAIARGEYVTYLCDDDLYYPQRLELMTAALDEGHDVVYGSQDLMEGGPGGWRLANRRNAWDTLTKASCVVDHSSVMHTLKAAQAVGGWDDGPQHWRQGDAAFWDKLTGAGYVFHPVRPVTDAHRYHALTANAMGGPY